MMGRSKILVALVLLVLIQSMFVESWLWRRRRVRTTRSCNNYPISSKYDRTSGYYYGSTELSLWGKSKRGDIVVNTWAWRHSLLQFRGTIFEWGSKDYDNMNRPLNDCKIKWTYQKKSDSRCLLSDAMEWSKKYEKTYGSYGLLFNNCHHFVNRLRRYLATNCGR